MPASGWKNKGRTQVQDLHLENGVDGIPGGCQAVSEDQVRFFTDSSAVLGMIFKDSGMFLEFVET